MRDQVRGSVAISRAAMSTAVTYRGQILVWFATGLFPLLMMAVWLTVVATSGPPRGWTTADLVAYYVAAAVMWQLSGQNVVWRWDADMRSGDLSMRLLRPTPTFAQYAAADLGERLVVLALLVPCLVVAVLLVPSLSYELTPARAVAVPAAVVLAYTLGMGMSMLVGLTGFWTTQTANLWMLVWGMGSFASGWVAPLELMPDWLRSLAVVLPFRTTLGFPVELATGRLDASATAVGFAIGLGWLGVVAAAYRLLWGRGIRRYQAVAG